MSENDYEYQCMRAELLGLPKPEKPDIEPNRPRQCDEDDNDVAVDELDLDVDGERYKRVGGGLDEIGSILQTTQKKINRFKTVFGSVTSLLKGRGSAEGSTENLRGSNCNISDGCTSSSVEDDKEKNAEREENSLGEDDRNVNSSNAMKTSGNNSGSSGKKMDVESMLSNHIQTLDTMVYKADQINASMNHQNKMMKNFLNK